MAPHVAETEPVSPEAVKNETLVGNALDFNHSDEIKGTATQPAASFPHYLPVWDPATANQPALKSFEHYDHGKDADPSFRDLLPQGQVIVDDLTPSIGTEVQGVQLSQLTKKGKDQLALLVAQRKVVVFRDQDFANLPIDKALEFGEYFGRHHIHPTSGTPQGYPEIHLVHRAADDNLLSGFLANHTTSVYWHSDVTYEEQPPGTTFLYLLDGPKTGGDTLFTDTVQAYNRLSPEFKKRLHGLRAVHSAVEQAQSNKERGGIVRRQAVEHEHPIVRTHPVTGEKSIFVNPLFTRHIVGYKKEESDYLLKFLYDHIGQSQDLQVRLRWQPGTVVVWDNRVTSHTAIFDWHDGQRRHLARITLQAERPYETPFEG
ncbi:alpha-ketoglutarate-dependent taurine dioxygenase [Talaromyces proteolyticus]|uniref:Alpha-ketoglutarate-dependent taurine dioxygenase n=1 Tax=Talaromyces proteolyticus TaxID=1131652 RepID=A0AAD4PVL7_9EURO|nr:alpha-ketoglutarate-dependent taurine dioxygenase [Talaromyces proteolyticus]KAH8691478.1 alpha-ketoglutarate-dependent taurine dioxygenase [Talaromyces proteolyticus]